VSWASAVNALGLPFLDCLVIGTPGAQDVYCNWQGLREIDEAGALLVRPDGMVAWRHQAGADDDQHAASLLGAALAKVLGDQAVATRPL
jgi:2,4-dichlorophenol 6-monooxygenase